MKILVLDSTYRHWLNLKGALALDGDLNEKFIGLTHSESIFFAETSKDGFAHLKLQDVNELKRFLELHERHELALAFQRKTHSLKAMC